MVLNAVQTVQEAKWPDEDVELGEGKTQNHHQGQRKLQELPFFVSSPANDGITSAAASSSSLESIGTGTRKARLFEWNIQEYKVKTKRKKYFTILRNIVGCAKAGTLSAIIGPSGCGKTSLLDCLALRNQTFTGTLRLDEQALTGRFFLHTGYVHQKELFFSHLSVREHLTFHAINRLSRVLSLKQCEERVDMVMDEVDLTRVAESQIGGGELYVSKGLSGGERKRLNIAMELLADPSILLLDEPTSGLDSVMGELICLLLKSLATRPPKRIIITAVHSPSSRLFTLFTHVTLLTSDGQLAYWGPRQEMLSFFERLRYICPARFNPADFALELASTKIIRGELNTDELHLPDKDVNGSLLVRSDSSIRLVEACKREIVEKEFDGRLQADDKHKSVMGVKGARSSHFILFRTNLWRAWLQESREKMGLLVRMFMNVTLGLVFGFLYFRQLPKDNGRNTAGFLFSLIVTLLIASSIQVCLHFPFDYAILMREYYAGANTPGPYFLGRTMSSIPQSMLFLLMGIIPYFMTGLTHSIAAFGYFCLVLFLMNFAAQSIGYLSSSFSSNPIVGLSILPLLITPMILFSGMLYERHSVPRGLRWIQDISVMNYGFALLVLNQIDHVGGQVKQFLTQFLQIHSDEFNMFLVDLALLAVAYRVLAMLILLVRVRFISKVQ